MASSKIEKRDRTTPAEAFRVMNCQILNTESMHEFEAKLDDNRKLRCASKNALDESVKPANTDSSNRKVDEIYCSK